MSQHPLPHPPITSTRFRCVLVCSSNHPLVMSQRELITLILSVRATPSQVLAALSVDHRAVVRLRTRGRSNEPTSVLADGCKQRAKHAAKALAHAVASRDSASVRVVKLYWRTDQVLSLVRLIVFEQGPLFLAPHPPPTDPVPLITLNFVRI